jgi:nickel/cobalt transporter (NicO) family protein
MVQILLGSLMLSLIHVLLPSHWLPLVALSRAEKWSRTQTLQYTFLLGFAHVLSTVGLGVVLGLIGKRLAHELEFFSHLLAPLLLIILGLIYFSLNNQHSHHEHLPPQKELRKMKPAMVLLTMAAAMFFSPCLEIESYFLAAGAFGNATIFWVALIYTVITVGGMLLLVGFTLSGLHRLNLHFMEHHEKRITGTILILTGVLGFFAG